MAENQKSFVLKSAIFHRIDGSATLVAFPTELPCSSNMKQHKGDGSDDNNDAGDLHECERECRIRSRLMSQ